MIVRLMLIFKLLVFHLKYSCSWEISDLPKDKYMSYLQYPHINFRGKFRANVATGNNVYTNFDSENFFAHQDSYGNVHGGKNQWNPEGTNDFTLRDCYVSSACHVDGNCTSKPQGDKICGNVVTDGGVGSFAKIVDIDTAHQLVPEVWGLKVKVPGFFVGDMEPTPLTEYWTRLGVGDSGKGGIYQSVLKNVIWETNYNTSTAASQMKATMQKINSSELSIIFYLDLYGGVGKGGQKDFVSGRIMGTIGVSGPLAPKLYTWGRTLEPIYTKNEYVKVDKSIAYQYMHRADFVVNADQRRLYINFENSLKLTAKGSPMLLPGTTLIGYFKNKGEPLANVGVKCARNFTVLGHLPKAGLNNFFWNYSAILSLKLSEKQATELENRQLAVLQVKGKECKLLTQEPKDGILVKPMNNWVFRLQSGQSVETKFFVAKFGKPYPNATVILFPQNTVFDPVPGIGDVGKASFSMIHFETNEDGITCAKFPTISSTFQRTGLDGNLEGYPYFVNGSVVSQKANFINSRLVLHVYHNRTYTEPITWIDHVYPLFRQYANLYPVMSSRSFDMANYFDVIDHKDIMKISLTLPMSHPSFMPATRDLSEPRLKMILSWLGQEKPAFGDVTKIFTKHYLQGLLQLGLEIAHAGLPPMLTALWSIREKYNGKAQQLINRISWQEIEKMTLIGNLYVAIGGKPKFLHQGFVPKFLGKLPGGIKKNLILSLEKVSVDSLLNQFLELKRPDYDPVGQLFRQTIYNYVKNNRKKCRCKHVQHCKKCLHQNASVFSTSSPGYKKCKQVMQLLINQSRFKDDQTSGYNQYIDPQERHVFEYHSSVGQFLNHILLTLTHLTDCGVNNTIFTGNSSMQIINNGKMSSFASNFIVHDYATAVKTIKTVLDITHSTDEEFKSQYSSIRLMVKETSSLPIVRVKHKIPDELQQETNYVMKKFREKIQQSPLKRITLFEKGVWPIAANCKQKGFPKGKIRNLSKAFNSMFTLFLRSFELLYKVSNTTRREEFLTTIHLAVDAMSTYAGKLVRLPLGKHGNKNIGPNAAPTFEIDFNFLNEGAKKSFKYLKTLQKNNWRLDMFIAMISKIQDEIHKTIGKPPPGMQTAGKSSDMMADEDILIPLAKNKLVDVSVFSDLWSIMDD